MVFLKRKKIVHVKIIDKTEGISEDEEILNCNNGYILGGYDGMFQASIFNEFQKPTTTFEITYNDGTLEEITVNNGSLKYNYYIKFIK